MKKIIAIAACTMLAVMTQAAAVGWSVMGATDYKNCDYKLFVIGINDVTDVSQITSLVAAGSDVEKYAFAGGAASSAGVINVSNTSSGKSIEYSGSGTDVYNAFVVIWDAKGENASVTSTAKIEMANNSQSKTFSFGNQGTNLKNNTFPVPEPCSVALVALGLAALGLKRKIA